MGSHEILTLQFGHYSNYVGAHLWNLQEMSFHHNETASNGINHDALFREGQTLQGQVTFTPRLLLVDLKGSLKALSEDGDLYKQPTRNSVENLPVEVTKQEPEEKIPFQKSLEESSSSVLLKQCDLYKTVRVWSDFLYTRFHPRTVNIVKEYQHADEATAFDCFPLGTNLWNTDQFKEDFADKIRMYIEECDNLQGFHVLSDAENAFGGLSTSCLQYLQDDFASKCVLSLPIIQSTFPRTEFESNAQRFKAAKADCMRLLNLGLCFQSLTEHSSLVVPLSVGTHNFRQFNSNRQFNHLLYDPQLPYHSSAILASALDTFTLRYRLKQPECSLNDMCHGLSANGKKVSAASICLPFGLAKNQDLIDCLNNWDGPLSRSVTPNCEISNDDMVHLYTVRGIHKSRLKRPPNEARSQKNMPAYDCKSVKEMFEYYMECTGLVPASGVTVFDEPLPVKTPYPDIFDRSVDCTGNITGYQEGHTTVESVPILSGLHSGAAVGGMVQMLHEEVCRVKFEGFHQFHAEGIDCDEFKERMEHLQNLTDSYDCRNYII